MKRLLLRGSAVGIVIATFIAAGLVGATAIRAKVDDASANRSAKAAADSARRAQRANVVEPIATTDSAPAAATPTPPITAPTSPASATRAGAPIRAILPMGQSELPDSVTATRGDTDVVVSFDLMMIRTRRAEKFEQFVRATLPAIYGRGARDALSKIPDGGLASQGELLTELPRKGLRIPVGTGWMIRLFPETRQGQDGPLVVRYRVSVVPGGL
jgi:hypothetical protein